MSALKKIRENVGLVIIVIAVSLFSFIFVDLVKNIGGGGPDTAVAQINGEDVEYEYLSQKLESVERTAGELETSEQRDQLRIQAWQALTQELVLGHEFKQSGITITPSEEKMMMMGYIYHPVVRQWGFFNDSLGQYNPARVDQVLEFFANINMNDPSIPDQYKRQKLFFEDMRRILQSDRKGSKWQTLVSKAMFVSDNEIQRAYNEEQRSATISYLLVPYTTISDSTVSVSESDFSEYYNKRKEAFKREAEAQVKYTWFEVVPSADDSSVTRGKLVDLINDFRTATRPYEFANSNTDRRNPDTLARPVGELPAAVLPILGRTDTVVGPVTTANGYALYRIARVEDDSASVLTKARHILLQVDPVTKDSAAARNNAKELVRKLHGDSSIFAATALAESKDFKTSGLGGQLGWLGQSEYGPDFDKAVRDAGVGSVFTVESPQGIHVVQVTERSTKRYAVVSIEREVAPSTATNEAAYKRASMYHGEVLGGADMDQILAQYPEAQTRVSPIMTQNTYSLLGLKGARPVITWAFKSEKGAVTPEIIEAERALVVARVEYKGEKGYRSLEDVKETIRPEVIRWVKARAIKEKLSGSAGGDLQAMATAYGAGATTGTAADLRFNSDMVAGLGNEPKVVGRAFGLKQGEVSKPLTGNAGVYVIKLDGINEPATPLAPEFMAFRKDQAQNAKRQAAVNASYMGLIDIADIEDYRAKFDF